MMGNKSKKKKKVQPKILVAQGNSKILTPEQKVAATRRLVNLFKTISEPPEPLLTLFARLEMPWRRMDLDGNECYVITVEDFDAAESRNQSQGSIANRVYKDVDQLDNSVSSPSLDPNGYDDSFGYRDADIRITDPAVEPLDAQEDSEDSDEYDAYIRGAQG